MSTTSINGLRHNGKVICKAINEFGSSQSAAQLFINDLDKEFQVRSDNETIVIDYSAIIECGAASFKYGEVNWTKNGELVDESNSECFIAVYKRLLSKANWNAISIG